MGGLRIAHCEWLSGYRLTSATCPFGMKGCAHPSVITAPIEYGCFVSSHLQDTPMPIDLVELTYSLPDL